MGTINNENCLAGKILRVDLSNGKISQESSLDYAEKTLEFHKRSVMNFKNRAIVLEDLGSHVLMFIGENVEDILAKVKRIRKRAGIPDLKRR